MPDPGSSIAREFLLTIFASTRYARELAAGTDTDPRHPLGYTFLTRLKHAGHRAEPLPFEDSVTFARKRNRFDYGPFAYATRAAMRGVRVIGMDTFGAMVALASTGFSQRARVAAYCYTAAKPTDPSLRRRALARLRSMGLRRCEAVFFSTRIEQNRGLALHRLDPHRTAVLHSGVDTKYFAPSTPDSKAQEFQVVSRGRAHQLRRGQYVFVCGDMLRGDEQVIRATAHLPIHLVRTSLHDLTGVYAQLLAKFPGARVTTTVLQDVPYVALRELYRNAACCVVPTDNSWQPAGWTSMTESMACGTPTLVARGINSDEVSLLTSPAAPPCVGTWDLNDPSTLTPLIEQCVAAAWPRERVDNGLAVARELLDVDIVADALLRTDAWQRFVAP
jgi:glycosyltransferase involved in cell wall biosynthesis